MRPALVGELRERDHGQVRRAEDDGACDRAAEHAELESEGVGDPGRHRVEDRRGTDAFAAGEVFPESFAAQREVHGPMLSC